MRTPNFSAICFLTDALEINTTFLWISSKITYLEKVVKIDFLPM